MRSILAVALASSVLTLAGCSDGEPKRFRISGEALFDGQPIPYGDVVFTPDGSAGNKGPQGIAQIRNGHYDSGNSDGKGIAGGATVIRITGLSGQGGKVLCEYEYTAELPQADSTLKIEVPKNAAPQKPNTSKNKREI